MENIKGRKEVYPLIDILKLIAAFLVIGLHTRPFSTVNTIVDNLYVYNIANYAVPFFYACTGFFVYSENIVIFKHNLKNRLNNVIKAYVLWTFIYLPLTIYGWVITGNGIVKNFLLFIRNFIFVGENYYSWTLWYLNGLIVALISIYKLCDKLSINRLFKIGCLLYIIGYAIELKNIYYSCVPSGIQKMLTLYITIFSTTRNGIFRSFCLLLVGLQVASNKACHKRYNKTRMSIIIIILFSIKILGTVFLEEYGRILSQVLDLPTFYIMFIYIIQHTKTNNCNSLKNEHTVLFRRLSSKIYYIHMYFVALCAIVIMGRDNCNNPLSFIIVSCLSTVFGYMIILFDNKTKYSYKIS